MIFSNSNFTRNNIPLDTKHRYELMTKKYIDQVVEVFTKAFCRYEPMTAYLKMDEEKYKVFARAVAEKAVKDQLSVVALDHDKVIAFAISEDIADPGVIPDFDPKFVYILGLLELLGEHFFKGKVFGKKEIAHLFITAVAEDYCHQGLSTQVNFKAMDIAAENNFKSMYCEFTHHYNLCGVIHHLKNKQRQIGHCVYKNFKLGDVKPFAHLEGGAKSYLWEVSGDNKINYQKNQQKLSEEIEKIT